MHTCYRSIDKPQIMYGLEMEDICIIVLLVGLGCLIVAPYVPGILGICSWIVLVKFKQGKPPGYLMHWLYAKGLDWPGLIPSYQRIQQYGAYGKNTFAKHSIF